MATHEQILDSLKRHVPYLQTAVHRGIADGLGRDGLLEQDGARLHASATAARLLSINAAAAARPELREKLQRLMRFAAHRGVKIDPNQVIDPATLDSQLSGKDLDSRITIKNELYMAGCLPA